MKFLKDLFLFINLCFHFCIFISYDVSKYTSFIMLFINLLLHVILPYHIWQNWHLWLMTVSDLMSCTEWMEKGTPFSTLNRKDARELLSNYRPIDPIAWINYLKCSDRTHRQLTSGPHTAVQQNWIYVLIMGLDTVCYAEWTHTVNDGVCMCVNFVSLCIKLKELIMKPFVIHTVNGTDFS